MSVQIIQGDARSLPLADDSVDLVVTSPPYFGLRSYQDGGEHYAGQIGDEATPAEFLDALVACTAEWMRVLKPSGSMWVNLGDKYVADNRGSGVDVKRGEAKHAPRGPLGFPTGGMRQKSLMGIPWRYALRCIDDLGLILRAEVIWSKPNGLPESVTDRVRRSHEQWFHFTLQPRYFSAVDEIRGHISPRRTTTPLASSPGSVWTVPTEPLRPPDHLGVDHFAAFPTEWPRRIIAGWSPSGVCVECGEGRRPVVGTVCEPCGGFRPNNANQCPSCGHRRDWKSGRVAEDAMDADWSASGHRTPRHPGNHQSRSIPGGYTCSCIEALPTHPLPCGPRCRSHTPPDTRPAVVLDPFGGTGTTAHVAHALGRHGITVDLSHDYCRIAADPTVLDGRVRKVLGVAKAPLQVDGQADLFGEAL